MPVWIGVFGIAWGGATQYFRPRPSRFSIHSSGWVLVQRLWTYKFLVVSKIMNGLNYLWGFECKWMCVEL